MNKITIKQYFLFIFILLYASLSAQEPTDQDCLGAITVCQSIYIQPNSYSGTGNYPNEIPTTGGCPGNCMLSGEKNDVWYIFTVNTGGNLGFLITPNNPNNDYDWVVYSLDQYDCEDIYSHTYQMQVSCNWSATPGPTGATLVNGGNCSSAGGSKYCKFIPVLAGETYVLNISNWSPSQQSGYTLDFGLSTANIYDDIPPEISTIFTDDIQCGTASLEFEFTERVLCNSVQKTDFSLTGPSGSHTITNLFGETCDQGGEAEDHFRIDFDPPIYESGTYSLNILYLSFIQDDCSNTAFVAENEFDISLNSPTMDAGEDQNIAYGATAQLDGTVSGGSGEFIFDWQPEEKLIDNTVEDPLTINLTETTEYSVMVEDESNNCRSTDEVIVNIVGGPMSVSIIVDNNFVCAGDPAIIEAVPSGGSGTYDYTWTSDPPGIDYTTNIITVSPEITTTYFVVVTDGYTILNSQTTVTVYPTPIADAGPEQEINMGTFTYLDGSVSFGQDPYIYNWSPPEYIDGDITLPNPKTSILNENQIYLLNVVDDNGCMGEPSEVTIIVTGSALGAQPISEPPQICIGQTATLISNVSGGGGGPYSLEWRTEDGTWTETGDNVQVNPTTDTKYFLKVNDGYTTKDSITLYLAVNPLPIVNLIPIGYPYSGDTISVCVRDTVILDAGNDTNPPNMSYLWNNGWGDRYFTAGTNGNLFDFKSFNVITTNNITGCEDNSSIYIIFDFTECAIGISENNNTNQPLFAYPNPNSGIFQISTLVGINSLDIELVDLLGRVLFRNHYKNIIPGGWTIDVNINKLPKGIYLLKYEADNKSYSQKIIRK